MIPTRRRSPLRRATFPSTGSSCDYLCCTLPDASCGAFSCLRVRLAGLPPGMSPLAACVSRGLTRGNACCGKGFKLRCWLCQAFSKPFLGKINSKVSLAGFPLVSSFFPCLAL